MTDIKALSGPRVLPHNGNSPKKLVILLHGLGADGNDLISLAENWTHLLPDTEFIAPNAPFPCDMAPWGHQWFSLQVFSPEAIHQGVVEASQHLNAFIDQALAKRSLSDENLALVGFSQGTMMALHVALRRPQQLAAVLGYSGALAGAETLSSEIKSRPPLYLIHGDQDLVIPIGALFAAEIALTQAGCNVKSLVRAGLAHGIDTKGIEEGGSFLAEALSTPLKGDCASGNF